jgi:hypothetical protein
MTPPARWGVSLTVAGLVATSSLLAGRLTPAPPAARPPTPAQSPSPSLPPYTPSPTVPSSSTARPSPSFRPIKIAATAAGNRLFGVEPTDCPTCVSGSRVMYVGQGHGIVLHVRDIPAAGRRTLIIYYESDGARPLLVAVGDSPVVTLTLPGKGNWITPAQAKLSIDLPSGDSDIKLFHPDKPAPDLDQIVIR